MDSLLDQRYPLQMIDAVCSFEKGESLSTKKNITGAEWCFGDGVGLKQVFPPTLIIEAAAQTSLIFERLSRDVPVDQSLVLALGKIESEFFSEVLVGDQCVFTTRDFKMFSNTGFITVDVLVAQQKVAYVKIFYKKIKV